MGRFARLTRGGTSVSGRAPMSLLSRLFEGTGAPIRLAWEHTHREMLPSLLLLHELEKRGLDWSLSHVRQISPPPRGPGVVFLPFYYDESDIRRYLFRGEFEESAVVNLCYEQMHFRCGRGYLLPSGDLGRQAIHHCVWGPRYRSLLIEHGVPEEHIHDVGHPRFDLYRHHPELLISRAQLAEMYGLDRERPWMLVPFNFNLSFVSPTGLEALRARGYELTSEFVEGVGRAREAFIQLVPQLARQFPEIEFILRVHPAGFESEALYAEARRGLKNLHIIADWDIANWISQAALVLVWNSTSAMEAMVAGVPVMSFEPEPFAERFDYDVNRILTTVRSPAAVIERVESLPKLPDDALSYDWMRFEEWYAFRDGKNTHRLAELAAQMFAAPETFRLGRRLTTPELRKRARLAAVVDRVPMLRPVLRRWIERPPKKPEPNPGSLRTAVRTLDARPLGDFLR